MIVYINQNGEIHDVGTTTDETLSPVEIIDDEENPFTGWSDARICCYRVQVVEGRVVMMTPYVDTRLIDFIDKYGTLTEQNMAYTEYLSMMTGFDLPDEEEEDEDPEPEPEPVDPEEVEEDA